MISLHEKSSKPTLRAHTQSPQGFFSTLVIALRDKISSLIHPLLHLIHVFLLREFASDDTEYDVLVLRQALQRLKASCSGCVVFEIVCINVQVLEELLCNTVVATFREVAAVDEIAAT